MFLGWSASIAFIAARSIFTYVQPIVQQRVYAGNGSIDFLVCQSKIPPAYIYWEIVQSTTHRRARVWRLFTRFSKMLDQRQNCKVTPPYLAMPYRRWNQKICFGLMTCPQPVVRKTAKIVHLTRCNVDRTVFQHTCTFGKLNWHL